MASLAPLIKQRYTDQNGEPLVGGKVYTFIAGTSTPKATFRDKAETITNTNPVILDANGQADIWLRPSLYKFVLTDANDVIQYTIDNVAGDAAGTLPVAGSDSYSAYNYTIDSFTGDGVLTTFTLSKDPITKENLQIYISGVYQEKSEYSINGTSLTFSSAPPNGDNIEVVLGYAVPLATVSDGAITTAKLANGAVTKVKMSSLGQQLSASSGLFQTTGSSPVDVTNLSVTITTTGRPVMLMLVDDGTGTAGGGYVSATRLTAAAQLYVNFVRGSTVVSSPTLGTTSVGGTDTRVFAPPSAFSHIDVVAAGTYTYKIQLFNITTANTPVATVAYTKLLAFEL